MEASETYKEYRLEKLCGPTMIKRSLYLNNQPSIFTFNSTSNIRLKCHVELHLFATDFGFSVFTEALMLDDTPTCMTDYVQFGRDFVFLTSHKSEKQCGKVKPTSAIVDSEGNLLHRDFGSTPFTRRSYVEETDAEMDMWMEIHPTYGNNSKEIKLIVTPFRKSCLKSGIYKDYRPCPGSTKCIRSNLFCDGVINCPEMPKDEEADHCEETVSKVEKYHNVPLAMIILLAVLVVIALIAYFIRDVFVICRHLTTKRSTQGANPGRQRETRTSHPPLRGDPTVGTHPAHREPQSNTHELRTQERENETRSTAPHMPYNPPAYSDIVSNSPYDPPPSYQSFL